MKNLRIYTVFLTVFVLISISSCSETNTNTPAKSVTSFFNLLKAKEFKKITKLYVTKEGNKLSAEEEAKIEEMIGWVSSEYEKNEGLDNVIINNEEISEDGNSAIVEYTLNFKNGETSDDKVHLTKINGDWLFKITN